MWISNSAAKGCVSSPERSQLRREVAYFWLRVNPYNLVLCFLQLFANRYECLPVQEMERGRWPRPATTFLSDRKERGTPHLKTERCGGGGSAATADRLVSDRAGEMVEIAWFVRPDHLPLFILGGRPLPPHPWTGPSVQAGTAFFLKSCNPLPDWLNNTTQSSPCFSVGLDGYPGPILAIYSVMVGVCFWQ